MYWILHNYFRCIVGLYYGITIAIVSFGTAMTVLTLNIHHMGARGHEPPKLIKKICFGLLAKLLCLKLENTVPYQDPQTVIILSFLFHHIIRNKTGLQLIAGSLESAN